MEKTAPPATARPRSRLGRVVRGGAIGLAVLVALVYVALCGFLYVEQTAIEYPGHFRSGRMSTPEAVRQAALDGLVPWDRPTPGATSPQGFVAPDFSNASPRGTVVFFHGNGNWAGERVDMVEALRRRGFRTFLYEYPGYGGRPGLPSEAAIVPDGRALIRALDQAGLGPVYVWGESLGSGVTAAVCADPALPVHGAMLVTPWDNVANVGLYRFPWFPVRCLMHDTYDSIGNLAHFRHPICVMRGNRDDIIPAPLTLNLFAHLPDPKKIMLQDGYGHGNWPRDPSLAWWDEALDFIAPKAVK